MVKMTATPIHKKHVARRAEEGGDGTYLTYCRECAATLTENGRPAVHLLDLLFGDGAVRTNQGLLAAWKNRIGAEIWGKSRMNQKIVRVLLCSPWWQARYMYTETVSRSSHRKVISARLRAAGPWGVIGYVLLLTLLPLLLFPDSVLVMAGGMVFGLAKGTVLTSIGSLLGGMLAYFIARGLGHGVVKKLIRTDNLVDMTSGRRGLFLILILRLVPLFPFMVVSTAPVSPGLTGKNLLWLHLWFHAGHTGIHQFRRQGTRHKESEFVFAVASYPAYGGIYSGQTHTG